MDIAGSETLGRDLLEDRLQIRLVDDHVTSLLKETSRTGEIADANQNEALDRVVAHPYRKLAETRERTIAWVPWLEW